MKPKKLTGSLVFAAALGVFGSGCATKMLWDDPPFARYHEPASPPELKLFHQGESVLVEYTEVLEGKAGSTRWRAFWLQSNLQRLEDRKKPAFIRPNSEKLEPVPVVQPGEPIPLNSSTGIYAVVRTNVPGFILFSGKTELGAYNLPVYEDGSGRTKQILLTGPAVMLDMTVVGGVLAYWCLPGLLSALNGAH